MKYSTGLPKMHLARRDFLKCGLYGGAGLLLLRELGNRAFSAETAAGQAEVPPLPYAENALEPYTSARTMSFHYGKHHKAYAEKLRALVKGTPLADKSVEEVIRLTAAKAGQAEIFNNAAQFWNHSFFWKCMRPDGGGKPAGKLAQMIDQSFGDFESFKKQFISAAVAQFGSGWTWLVLDGEKVKIMPAANADNPMAHGLKAILTVDVWEHAYYLDYENRRKDFVTAWLEHLINWDFAAQEVGA